MGKTYQDGPIPHKVGFVHYYGQILADALKSDESGHTVSLYKNTGNSAAYSDICTYIVIEWDESGQYEISVDKYDTYEQALEKYLFQAFNVSL